MPMQMIEKTPKGMRLHILLLGRRNVGKSSLINALTNKEVAIVSSVAGTTTDPVERTMEFPKLGPVVLIDTAGFDDDDPQLGRQRVKRTMDSLDRADLVVWVGDGRWSERDDVMVQQLHKRHKRTLYVLNKIDCTHYEDAFVDKIVDAGLRVARVSARTKAGIGELQSMIAGLLKPRINAVPILSDLLPADGHVLFVVPIDAGAPRGRLILPQVQAIRDILDAHQSCSVCQTGEVPVVLRRFRTPPELVVTDSQDFKKVALLLPPDQMLTSFSILMARLKADFEIMLEGARRIATLPTHAKILVAEACTHKPTEEDIGTVKIPALIRRTHPDVTFDYAMGQRLPDLSAYDLVIHCGACVWNRAQMQARLLEAKESETPITNYGMVIAACHGILERAIEPLCQ